jgi:hypothetical protein
MTMSMTDIPVLHSTAVAHLYPQVVFPIFHGVDGIPYTSTKEARQGNTTRPLQSSTSFRKPATVSRERSIGKAIAAKSTQEPPYTDHSPTTLAPFG